MTKTEMFDKLMKAMGDFNEAYHKLLTAIDDYEVYTAKSVNDLQGFTESYPFDKSLDELAIHQWVRDVYVNNREFRFDVRNYEYMNTGGNTMVGIHDVWLPDENKMVYVFTNEEGCTISPVDYIREDFEPYQFDDLQTEDYDWGRVTGYEKRFELLRACFNAYTEDDCRYFGITRRVPYYLLSDALQKKVDADYLVWSEAVSDGLVETNGREVIIEPDYNPQLESERTDEWLQEIKDYQQWHDNLVNKNTTDEELDKLYMEEYTLTIAGKTIKLPYDADTFNHVNDLLLRVIEQW